jgi:uncharacterized protein involved in exopolysaccharide biosynthesis
MSQPQNELSQQNILELESNDDEIDLIYLIQTLGEEKWLLLGLPFLCACVAVVISLNLTPMYTARATFFVPEKQSNSPSAVLEQLGGLGGIVAGSLSKSPIEMHVALMKSNIIQDEIITKLDLVKRYKKETQEDARKELLTLVKISTEKKSGLIIIEAEDQSPEFAATLANAYLRPFRAVLNRMSIEEAQARRDFFSHQIEVIAQRPFRDPFLQSTFMGSLIKQYEGARIDEAREHQILFPIDVAKIPERASSPKRVQLVLIVGLGTLCSTILLIWIKRAVRNAQNDPTTSTKWASMKKAWRLRA